MNAEPKYTASFGIDCCIETVQINQAKLKQQLMGYRIDDVETQECIESSMYTAHPIRLHQIGAEIKLNNVDYMIVGVGVKDVTQMILVKQL